MVQSFANALFFREGTGQQDRRDALRLGLPGADSKAHVA